MITSIYLLSTIGLLIALYAAFVEKKVSEKSDYKAACDLSDTFSCTKAMRSDYSHLLYFSNSTIGIIYYVALQLLNRFGFHTLLLLAITLGCIGSCYFGYILYFKIRTVCILCTALYIINFMLLYLALTNIVL